MRYVKGEAPTQCPTIAASIGRVPGLVFFNCWDNKFCLHDRKNKHLGASRLKPRSKQRRDKPTDLRMDTHPFTFKEMRRCEKNMRSRNNNHDNNSMRKEIHIQFHDNKNHSHYRKLSQRHEPVQT